MGLEHFEKLANFIIKSGYEFKLLYVLLLVPFGVDVIALLFNLETVIKNWGKKKPFTSMHLVVILLLVKICVLNIYLNSAGKHELISGVSLFTAVFLSLVGLIFALTPLCKIGAKQ